MIPQLAAGYRIHPDESAVIPFDDLTHAGRRSHKGRGIAGAVVALSPQLAAGLGVQRGEHPFLIVAKMCNHPRSIHQRRAGRTPEGIVFREPAPIVAAPQGFAIGGIPGGQRAADAHHKQPSISIHRAGLGAFAVILTATADLEGSRVGFAPNLAAISQPQAAQHLVLSLPGVQKHAIAHHQGRAVAFANGHLPVALQLGGPLFGWREILHPAIAIGAEPTGPVISRSGKSIGGKTEEQQDQAVHAESLMMPNAIEKYPHKKRAPESAPNPYKERF